ncbi:MAG: flagellar basal body-associated FliL family protein [Pirellulaceae bacterium]
MILSLRGPAGALAAVCLLAGAGASTSCSGPVEGPAATLEAAEILDLINEGHKKNDPQGHVEIDLGKFRVTHTVPSEEEVLLLVDFQLYGVLPIGRQETLEHTLPDYNNRLRDAVISLVQSIETEHLTDASLAFFKAELTAAINRVLQARLIRDVVFSNFSVHDAHEAPFPTGAPASVPKKKPAGGGH